MEAKLGMFVCQNVVKLTFSYLFFFSGDYEGTLDEIGEIQESFSSFNAPVAEHSGV